MNTICKKECPETTGYVSSTEREWIAYSAGQTVSFVNFQGDTAVLSAGGVANQNYDPGGSKGDCPEWYESLHQPLWGLGLYEGAELMVVHDRDNGNAPGHVCGHYMDMAPVNDVIINGTSYDNVYITFDSAYFFTKADGLIKAGEWMKVP